MRAGINKLYRYRRDACLSPRARFPGKWAENMSTTRDGRYGVYTITRNQTGMAATEISPVITSVPVP